MSTNIEIKHANGRTLSVSRLTSVRAALVGAVKAKADLRGADLRRADLRGADLYGADLYGANLCGADLYGANLHSANLHGADLRGADLYGANLHGANLYGADLRGADLYGANLRGADLRGANLYGANLYGANLRGADLRGANLYGADLYGADLRGANLGGANLYGANLGGAKNAELAIAKTRIIPAEGDYIAWKKAAGNRIVKLRIPDGAKRSHASGRKCRAERAEVLAIYNPDGSDALEATSLRDGKFRYVVGQIAEPTLPFDEDMWNECAAGIHHYITRAEAEAHV